MHTSVIGVSFPKTLSLPLPLSTCAIARSETRISSSVIMAAKTESDYESDEEFVERTSDELWDFYFGGFLDKAALLEHELSKKRFDRVERIIELLNNLYLPNVVAMYLSRLTKTAVQFMPAAGCPETLQFLLSHFGHGVTEDARQRMQAALHGGSVDTLRHFVRDSLTGRQEALWIAFRDHNLEMAVSILWEIDDILGEPQSCLVRPEVFCPAEFLRKVILEFMERLDRLGDKTNPLRQWLKVVLENAIKLRSRPHVEVLLDVMDPSRSGSIFTDHTWLMDAVFQSRCASILRCLLVRYPEGAFDSTCYTAMVIVNHWPAPHINCDPVTVIRRYHWLAGARILVEAGVKCYSGMPAEHAGILTLSLEDRCRIAVRCSLKSPLSESALKLPLPAKVKRRLLYQHGREKDSCDK